MAQQPSAHPKSVLRGHRSQVHITTFIRQNQRLASGDADGYVVLWDLTIMRPRAVWRAHDNAILGISAWGDDRLITEGRDNRLIVWKLAEADEAKLSTALPLDETVTERPQPWILFILEINTMNFCSFAPCPASADIGIDMISELLVAVPNTLQTEAVDIFHLPSQSRLNTIHLGDQTEKKGMVMALSLLWLDGALFVIAGYESGLAIVARRIDDGNWVIVYRNQAHTQPILSLAVGLNKEYFLTSGADAIITKHPIPWRNQVEASKPGGVEVVTSPLKILKTGHSGQQSLRIRSDGRIFATAGWDTKIRVYSAKTMNELAVLKWHDAGCYAAAFSEVGHVSRANADAASQASPEKGAEPGKVHSSLDTKATANQVTTLGTVVGELSVKERRIRQAKETHWLAAGSKDGKISLWDIY
ncbi:WD40 repeat-like protein [Xylariaceae sp. FL0594]|nr:WD40 repeat-like protein [Xylariaceae sp. FL0594]